MNERLQLFFDNLDKIQLYFGSDANKFANNLALKLTVRNIRFNYEDYEIVQQQIKAHTKWYQFFSMSLPICHAYYVHFAKTPEKIPHALHMYKLLTKKFNRGDQCYLAAIHIESEQSIQKIEALIKELMKQPSLKHSNLATNTCTILAARPESPQQLAITFEKYYQALVSIGFIRNKETKNCALLLTIGTGTYCEETFNHVQALTTFIQKSEISVMVCHYNTIALLALAKFEIAQFPALYDIHEEICRKLKIKQNHCNSLLMAAQIYTSNEAIGDLLTYELDYADFMYAAINDDFDSGSRHDGYGGGED